MILLLCCLCTGDMPFVCPEKFRPTYMWMHMKKAHGLSPESMKFSHGVSKLNKGRIAWTALIDKRRELVHREIYLDVTGLDSERLKSEAANERSESDSVGSPIGNKAGPFDDPDPWSAKALQELYGTRANSNPML